MSENYVSVLEGNEGMEPVETSNGAMTITVVAGMNLGQVDMEIYPSNLKSEIAELCLKEVGLEGKIKNLKTSARYRPFLKNVREETCFADDTEIDGFVRNGEKLIVGLM